MIPVKPLLLIAALLAPVGHLQADTRSFRCKNDLVNLGDTKASALLKCDAPVVKDSFCKPVVAPFAQPLAQPTGPGAVPTVAATTVVVAGVCETVDEWTYNPGRGQFMTTLRFESGRLVSIIYGDRVK